MEYEKPPFGFDTLMADTSIWAAALALQRSPKAELLLDDYRPWRKIRHVAQEAGIEPMDAWRAIKLSRLLQKRALPLRSSDGSEFCLCSNPILDSKLYRIDRAIGGGGAATLDSSTGALADEDQRRRLRIRTLMDEAAESSIIEGAATTRKNAVEMLRAGRAPRTIGEQMVMNNYRAMEWIKARLDAPLSRLLLCELQGILTERTIADAERGRLRLFGEDVRVWDDRDNTPIFTPPDARLLPDRLEALCRFANDDHDGQRFLHPLVKACILHFMIGYEHPFVDGNGRTARAVFYWYALRHGCRIFEYLAISEIIRKGSTRYPQAYLDTEHDDSDLTYFVLYKLDVIEQALKRLDQYMRYEELKIRRSERILRLSKDLNLRQRLILEHALRHPTTTYTVKSHANSNGISVMTARTDLAGLAKKRLFVTTKIGKERQYHPAPNLAMRLEKKSQ